MPPSSLLRPLLRQYGLITDESVLDALPELELLRQQFQIHTVEWLPAWYRSRALEEAVAQRGHSDRLGPEGLEHLKSRVEELASCAEEIVANHLGDDVWWHYDEAQTQETIVYSVRLCMGWLALPLRRSGYLGHYDWREILIFSLALPTGAKDERGFVIREKAKEKFSELPCRRLFCQDGIWDDHLYPVLWSDDMTETLTKYFQLVGQTQWRSQERQRERQQAQEGSKAAGVEQILGFKPIAKAPARTHLNLPPPPA